MRVEWHPRARRDAAAIVEYIADQSPRAAIAVRHAIEQQADRLVDFPRIGKTGRVPGTRELVVPPYILVYRGEDQAVRIMRVIHGARRWPETLG